MIKKPANRCSSWIVCSSRNQHPCLRLFCFPYAGGAASIFRDWSDCLPPSIEVCAIELPGRGKRLAEPPFTRVSALVQAAAQALQPFLNMPFAFFGHSMGALVSFELTRFIRRKNFCSPIHLFVSGRNAPQIPSQDSPLHKLPESEFVEALRHFNGTPGPVLQNSELMRLMLPVIRNDFAVCETYTHSVETPLDCSISAFGGLKDCLTSRDEVAAWREQTQGQFLLRMFPGNHFFLKTGKKLLLQAILQDLTEYL